jgi:hypothetical protein
MWKKKGKQPARVTVKYDVGFNNSLYIRGKGSGLSWEKGALMKNLGADTWVWEVEGPVKDLEFKVLINDQTYEEGENHRLNHGKALQYSPKFNR